VASVLHSGEFSMPVRVYIEDTDAGGIVYYVNYLKFMERGRTEYMRDMGFGKSSVFNEDLLFVVRDVAVTYLSSAILDDELQVTAAVSDVRGATVTMRQSVKRGGEVLVEGDIKIACVDKTSKKPRRLPSAMRDVLELRSRGS
jgi:tol-pal system-associated acyl-CoA thioesterase